MTQKPQGYIADLELLARLPKALQKITAAAPGLCGARESASARMAR
jgi:hypothetical protein